MIKNIKQATATVLKETNYMKGFLLISVLLYAAYIFVPVLLTPGNSIAFQINLLRPLDFALFLVMSLITALLIVMQIFVHNRSKKKRALLAVGKGGVSIYSAMFGGLLATAACSSCIAGIVGFLGAGSTLFIVKNRIPFVIGAMLIVLVSLLFVAKRVNSKCASCEIPLKENTYGK